MMELTKSQFVRCITLVFFCGWVCARGLDAMAPEIVPLISFGISVLVIVTSCQVVYKRWSPVRKRKEH